MKNIKYCKAWSENKNTRCSNRAMWGTNYCWSHYPKKALIVEFCIVFILTLILNDPAVYLLSKISPFHYLDKNKPFIDAIVPAIDKLSSIDKTTEHLIIFCSDKESGLNLDKSSLKISRKENQTYIPISGKLDKKDSSISFSPEKKLEDGEYLFEALLVDKANNITKCSQPFVVRETYELNAFVSYDSYDNSSESDKILFTSFFENNKGYFKNYNFYIYKLSIGNNDNIAILKDIYLKINMPEEILCCEQIGNYNATKADFIGPDAEALHKRIKGYIYCSYNSLNLKQIGPHGIVTFYILTGLNKLLEEPDDKIWTVIEIDGKYLSEGYGSVENRKIYIKIPIKRY